MIITQSLVRKGVKFTMNLHQIGMSDLNNNNNNKVKYVSILDNTDNHKSYINRKLYLYYVFHK